MWIARDYIFNELWIYKRKPIRKADHWMPSKSEDTECCHIEEDDALMFKDIKWEDEPIEVELIRKGK